VLPHERQTESGTDAVPGRAPAGEPFEDPIPFALCDAGSAVLDGEAEASRRSRRQLDPDGSTAVVACVLQQVPEDTFEADLVERGPPRQSVHGDDRHIGLSESRRHPPCQVDERHVLDVEIRGSGVDAGEFEQIDHHAVESPHLIDDDVERLLGPFRDVVAAPVEDLDGGGERSDRRPEFVAHVGREAGLTFDAGLDGVGHVVERPGETVEVRVGFGGEPRVETSRGDVGGSVCDLTERSEQPAAGGEPEQGGQHHRAERTQQQCGQDRRQRRLGPGEREGLEVARVVLGDVHTDGDVAGSVDVGVLQCAGAVAHAVDESLREVGDRVQDAGTGARCGRIARAEHGESVRVGPQLVVEEHADAGRIDGQLLADQVGIAERLLTSGVLILVEQVVAGQAVGDADQDHAGEERDEREEERDPRAQTEGSATRHRLSVAGGRSVVHVRCENAEPDGSPAAGGMPGGGRHPTGAA
jgi:hypothetical protein